MIIPQNIISVIFPIVSGKNTTVYIGVNVNRVSGVDENREVGTLILYRYMTGKNM